MALVAPVIKKLVEAKVLAAYQREFGDLQANNPEAIQSWQKQAKIAAEIAGVIIEAIQTQAEVAPGIPVTTAGSAAAQTGATVAPGKIL
jgi:hypothetical protein